MLQENGFRVDIGPTILVMKETFEDTYRSIGQDLNQRIKFVQLDPNYRIYYHDGTHMDLYNSMAKLAAECERIEPGVTSAAVPLHRRGRQEVRAGHGLRRRATTTTSPTWQSQGRGAPDRRPAPTRSCTPRPVSFFKTDKLRKAFSFHSMFLGLSPFDALAMYSLITYADLVEGMKFPMGGIYSIIEDMVALAGEMGVTLRTGTPVEEICIEDGKATGVRLAGGEVVTADIVVSNADLVYTYKQLVPAQHRQDYPDAKLDRMEYACSGYLLYLGVDKTYPHMRHQALYFSEDYRANLDAIFRTKTLPADPSFHLNNPTITDPSLAPPGHSVLYLLAPMPNLQGNVDWDEAAPVVREKLLQGLERLVDPEIRQHIVWEREYRPADWERDINATVRGRVWVAVARLLPVVLLPAAQRRARHPGAVLRRARAPTPASACRWCCSPRGCWRSGWRGSRRVEEQGARTGERGDQTLSSNREERYVTWR